MFLIQEPDFTSPVTLGLFCFLFFFQTHSSSNWDFTVICLIISCICIVRYLLNVWCLILTSSLSSAGPQKAREKTSHKTQTCFAWSLVQKLTELLSLLRRHLNLLWQLDEEWRRPRHSGGQERWKTVTIKTKFHGIRSQSFISCDYVIMLCPHRVHEPPVCGLWPNYRHGFWLDQTSVDKYLYWTFKICFWEL